LPKWLVNQDSKTTVVLVYIAVLVIFVPILVFYWYRTLHPSTSHRHPLSHVHTTVHV
jgi:hypothetical protein